MTPAAMEVPDTDWHVDLLYDFLDELGASVLQATHSRYVIDLNRTPTGEALYPGARNTELCPTTRFDDQPIYQPGRAPDAAQIEERRSRYWQPYHDRLTIELAAIKAHRLRAAVRRAFDPLRSTALLRGPSLGHQYRHRRRHRRLARHQRGSDGGGKAPAYTSVLNGRFKGGYITRRYGRPIDTVEAIQLELSQITYMNEDPPFDLREDRAAGIRPALRRILEAMLAAGAEQHREVSAAVWREEQPK